MMGWLQVALDLFGANAADVQPPPLRPDNSKESQGKGSLPKPLRAKKMAPKGPRGAPVWQLPVLSDFDLVQQGPRLGGVLPKPERSIPPGAGALPTETSTGSAPSVLHHAQATHRIALQTQDTGTIEVAYLLERAKRRSIGFLVSEEGLTVKAPRWVGVPEITQALHHKGPWILRKLSELQTRSESALTQRIVWADGAQLPFLGETLTLVLDPAHSSQNGNAQRLPPDAQTPYTRLQLHVPHGASPSQIRDAAKAWLLRQARQLFIERLDHFAPQLGVRWTRLTLSNAGTRWGSAKIDGSIRLHWRLIHFKPSIIDYVVVHELSHLRVMDHSPRFWDTVASLVPDYAAQRKHLRTQHLPKWE